MLFAKTSYAAIDANEIISMTNKNRVENNLSSLTTSNKLTDAAQQKANDMIKNNYWSHNSPAGVTPWFWIKKTGYKYSAAGENLAQGFSSSTDVMMAWKKSPSHNQNLVANNFCQIGVAVANGEINGKKTTVVVQMMACPKKSIGSIIEDAKKYILG